MAWVATTKLGCCPAVALGGPHVWVRLGCLFLRGPLSPTHFLAVFCVCQISPGLRPSPTMGLAHSVAFVCPSSCHPGDLLELPANPGLYSIWDLVEICTVFLMFLSRTTTKPCRYFLVNSALPSDGHLFQKSVLE